MTTEGGVRNPGQIRQQLKQVLFRHLQKLLRANFRQAPESCRHNHVQSIMGTGVTVGVCRWDQQLKGKDDTRRSPRGKLCDSRVFGCTNMAGACSWWEALRTKEEIRNDFKLLIASGDRGKIASLYPDVAALMWVLDGIDIATTVAELDTDPSLVLAPTVECQDE